MANRRDSRSCRYANSRLFTNFPSANPEILIVFALFFSAFATGICKADSAASAQKTKNSIQNQQLRRPTLPAQICSGGGFVYFVFIMNYRKVFPFRTATLFDA